ncbi:DUF6541 family protein [Leucobacter sp. wl10]|uniref:DUF6541 family protein n=1 Tax=Leucobacter sp. wl10 TaxID=2304677 RepID=UPI000E5A259E|nr:DUF6541 family protein [Leucobacter sp. wl10]RGE23189.1 hypothetical protein D1J51_02825 [Leucobacter sp. wl10]
MSSWIALAAASSLAVAIIAVLGIPAALALRLRGFAVVVVAIPAGLAVIALASLLAPIAGLGWSLLPALICAAALALLLLLLRRWLGVAARPRNPGSSMRALWIPVGAAAVGGGAIALSLLAGLGAPGAVSQTFDAMFHLNAVRHIMDSGSASPFAMDLTSPGAPAFYPTLWHAYVSLIVQLSGVSIPVATNAALITVSAVVWPLGAVALGRAVAGPSTRVTLVSGALSAAFATFPLFLAGYGVLYPNLFSLALLPFLLMAMLQLLNVGPARRAMPLSAGTRWILALGALGAAVLAHPGVLYVLLIWAAAPVLFAAVRAWLGAAVPGAGGHRVPGGARRWLRRLAAVVGVLAFALFAIGAWIVGRTSDNSWSGFYGPRRAVLEIIGGTPFLEGHAWAVSALVLFGAVLAWRFRPLRWLIGSAAALAAFYFISDAFPSSDWRTLFLSPWYNDPRRLAALVPFGAFPLAVLGASAGWTMLRPGLRRLAAMSARPRRSLRVLTAAALVFLVAVGQAGSDSALREVQTRYDPKEGTLLSEDELRLLERLPDEVPEDEVIANNPLNGSALAYALADREVFFPHANGNYDQRFYQLVDALVPNPATACELSRELDVEYVLDFGTRYIFKNDTAREQPFKRMKDLDRSPVLTEVDREGDAALFRISC